MTDLFADLPKPKPRVGYGNAMFIADLTMGVPDEVMRAKYKAGEYPDLHLPSVKGWRRLAGRRGSKGGDVE